MNKRIKPILLVWVALGISLNFIGGNLALVLRLPVYLDTIGTILVGSLLGPIGGLVTGSLSGLLTGITTDLFSLYYLPVQMVIGLLSGLLLKSGHPLSKQNIWWITLLVSLPGTICATLITFCLFHGITSSGSSIFVQLLTGFGFNQGWAIFSVQLLTDYIDRFIAIMLVFCLQKTSIK